MAEACLRVRREFELPERSVDDLIKHVNRGMLELYRANFNDYLEGFPATEVEKAIESVRVAYEADYLKHVAVHTKLYDGIESSLAEIAKYAKIAVITNKPESI